MHETDTLRDQAIHDEGIPKMVREFLSKGAPLETIHLDAYGRWFHEGEPFINQRLSRLFHRSLHQTEQGTWFLEIKPYTYPVTVALTDTFIDRIDTCEATTHGHVVGDDPSTSTPIDLRTLYTDGGEIIATVHQERPTRIVKHAYRNLLEALEVEDDQFFVQFPTQRVELKPLPADFFVA